jgi:adenylate kinase
MATNKINAILIDLHMTMTDEAQYVRKCTRITIMKLLNTNAMVICYSSTIVFIDRTLEYGSKKTDKKTTVAIRNNEQTINGQGTVVIKWIEFLT